MNIVILGAGETGAYLAAVLSKEEHNVIVIDSDSKSLEKLARGADVATRLGSGTDWEILEELLEHSPDFFLALTGSDETNLVACTIAKNLGYPKTVARVHQTAFLHRSRLDFARLFFVDHFIGTETMLSYDIYKCIVNPGNLAVENFANGAAQMRTLSIPEGSKYSQKSISQLKLPENLLIGLIRRRPAFGEEVTTEKILFPKGHDFLLPGDEVTLFGETKVMTEINAFFGSESRQIRSVVIVGGTSVAIQVCKILLEQKISVRMIEEDEQCCRDLAEQFPTITVFNHDPTDFNFLLEERVQFSDAFVACTASNEKNILAAALAKQAGCAEVIAQVSDESCAVLLRRLGIFFNVSEKVSVTNRIQAIIQEESVISVASLYHNRAKILEIKISPDSEIVGIPIANLRKDLPEDFLIALIENRGKIMIAKGSNILAPGDTVIVICHPKHVAELKKLF